MLRRLLFLTAAALALGACGSSTPSASTISDPRAIVSQSIQSFKAVKTVHFQVALGGVVNINLTGNGAGSAIDLKNTTAEGDADLANKNYHVGFSAPSLFGISGDLIVIGTGSYAQVSILGDKYAETAIAAVDPQTVIDDVNTAIGQPDVAPALVGNEPCGDQTCYHVSIKLTAAQVAAAVGSILPASVSSLGSGTIDVWAEANDLRPVKVTFSGDGGTQGSLNMTLTLSAYNGNVTIAPPPDSQIDTSSDAPSSP